MEKQIDRARICGSFLRAVVAFAWLCAAGMPAGCSQKAPEPPPPSLAGAWRSAVRFTDGNFEGIKDLEFLYVFNEGGTMTESSNYDGAPPVPPAYGVWRPRVAGTNQFEATYTYFNSKALARFEDVASGGGWLPSGRGVLTERYTIATDGQSYESELLLQLYDAAGQPIEGGGPGFGRGTRIQFSK